MLNTADLLQKELTILQAQELMAQFLLDEDNDEANDINHTYNCQGNC
jgi:hypothetical protein